MLIFALQPIAFGAWLPRIPEIQDKLGLGPGDLALALLGLPVGILLSLPIASRLTSRFGSAVMIRAGYPVFLATVVVPPLMSSQWGLFAALVALGLSISALELGMNLAADAVERAGTKLIMTTCHGFWSLGLMAGSLVGAGLTALAVTPFVALVLVALAVLPLAIWAGAGLPAHLVPAPRPDGPARPTLPDATLLGISAYVFGIAMTEGAMADWAAIYLRDMFAAGGGMAGLGFSVFAGFVAAGRFFGDTFRRLIGAGALARICGMAALGGMTVLLLAPATWVAMLGFAAIGVGVSVGFPLAVSAAAALPNERASGNVAVVTFMALLGFLVGPPMIGGVAELFDLRAGLGALIPALLASFLMIRFLTQRV